MEYYLTLLTQVAVLFILIGAGYIAAKAGLLNEHGIKTMINLVLFLSTPCVIIRSFNRPFEAQLLGGLGAALAAAIAVHGAGIAAGHLAFSRVRASDDQRVLRFGTVFSNAGYMSLPLQRAILGDIGEFYCAAYIAVINIVMWSYGAVCMGGRRELSVRRMLLTPAVIGVSAGLVLFLLDLRLPVLVDRPMEFLSNLNTPLPMLIVGYYLSRTDLRAAVRDIRCFAAAGLRLAVIPLAASLGMRLCGMSGPLLVSMTISVSAPAAAATTMFAARYDRNPALSVKLVSVTTLLSILTMPLMILWAFR